MELEGHWQGMGIRGDITLLLGLVTAIVSYLWIYRWRQRNDLGPKTWPLLGCYLELQANQHRLYDWMTEYAMKSPTATVSTTMLRRRMLWTGNPENVEFILKDNFDNFPKGPLVRERAEQFLGLGIFVVDGVEWKQHRKTAAVEFSSRKLRDFTTDAYREHSLKLIHILDDAATAHKQVDFQDLAFRMTMDSICKIGFGLDFGSLSPEMPDTPFTREFDRGVKLTHQRQFGMTWKILRKLNLGREKEMREATKKMDEFAYAIISNRKAEKLALEQAGKELEKNDLLSRFMKAKDDEGQLFTDRLLRDAIINFMFAGRDTSAINLSWFLYCLCCNPDAAEKCYEELLAVIGEDHESVEDFAECLTYESLSKLHYLHAALTETLRIYPVVPKMTKWTVKDCVLPDGTFVKSSTTVNVMPFSMGRSKSLWGSDVEQFRPERWLKDGVFQPESPFKFTAFQAGPRICLGKDSSYIQMKITAALLLRFFRIQLVPDHPIQYRITIVMPLLHGLKITLSRRQTMASSK